MTAPTTTKKWVSLITGKGRIVHRLFYLPPDESIGFPDRMAADFRVVFQILRADLENSRQLRVGRLNSTALDHFRESFAEYFKRYAFNEWYPLSKEEFQEYKTAAQEDIPPYSWQE
jgi:hypothetical protein